MFDLNTILGSIKNYQALKKKLENRRLDFDAKLNKLNKSKKENPALEEEMKTAQFKYEETLRDVQTVMATFSEREVCPPTGGHF